MLTLFMYATLLLFMGLFLIGLFNLPDYFRKFKQAESEGFKSTLLSFLLQNVHADEIKMLTTVAKLALEHWSCSV